MTEVPGTPPRSAGTIQSVACSVLIVDDAPELRTLAAVTLGADDRWDVVGRARSAATAAVLAAETKPDVVLIDLEMPWATGAGAIADLLASSPDSTIVLWTSRPASSRASAALALGATGIVHKTAARVDHLPDDLALVVGSDH